MTVISAQYFCKKSTCYVCYDFLHQPLGEEVTVIHVQSLLKETQLVIQEACISVSELLLK